MKTPKTEQEAANLHHFVRRPWTHEQETEEMLRPRRDMQVCQGCDNFVFQCTCEMGPTLYLPKSPNAIGEAQPPYEKL